MLARDAKAQFDGACAKYPVPDTRAMLYKVHGQVDLSLTKKPKMTYIDEIMENAKKPERRVPGPSEYKTEQSYDWMKTNSSKRYQWNKEKRTSFTDDVIKREKNLKGPADYNST